MATLFGMLASASLPQIAAAGLAAFVLAVRNGIKGGMVVILETVVRCIELSASHREWIVARDAVDAAAARASASPLDPRGRRQPPTRGTNTANTHNHTLAAANTHTGGAQIVVDGFAIPQRLRLRHIPGPPPKWLVGHALDAKLKHGMFLFEMWREMGSKYGRVFKWFWGTQPIITIRGEKGMADRPLPRFSGVCIEHLVWRSDAAQKKNAPQTTITNHDHCVCLTLTPTQATKTHTQYTNHTHPR